MTLEMLQKDMFDAMKNHEKDKKDVVSTLVSAVKTLAINEKCRDNITEELVNKAIMKEVKTVKEQIDTCPKDRTDLLDMYQRRYEIMQQYAPKMLSKEEIMEIITTKFADVIVTKNKGMIIKSVMGELKGKADGKLINACVAELIA